MHMKMDPGRKINNRGSEEVSERVVCHPITIYNSRIFIFAVIIMLIIIMLNQPVMGGIEIIVPPDLKVICDGTAILGGIEFLGEGSGGIIGSSSSSQEGREDGGAVVKIYGRAFMGGIEVTVKE